ncbi:MAG: DUF3572 domain-containing protein [Xanthobacteraceae bacterium]
MAKERHRPDAKAAAEALAVQALTFLANEPTRLGRFLAETGIGPQAIRTAAQEPGFLAGVLGYILGDESLLIAFAGEAGVKPSEVARTHAVLAGPAWEREVP